MTICGNVRTEYKYLMSISVYIDGNRFAIFTSLINYIITNRMQRNASLTTFEWSDLVPVVEKTISKVTTVQVHCTWLQSFGRAAVSNYCLIVAFQYFVNVHKRLSSVRLISNIYICKYVIYVQCAVLHLHLLSHYFSQVTHSWFKAFFKS